MLLHCNLVHSFQPQMAHLELASTQVTEYPQPRSHNITIHLPLQVIFPGCAIPSPALAQPTFNDIKNFACAHRVDFVSAAYIQTAEDAQYLRRFMVECDHGESIRLIARIENEVGMRNVDDILGEADGIMLCRTSLAMELGPHKLGLMQKLAAAKAQAAGLHCLP